MKRSFLTTFYFLSLDFVILVLNLLDALPNRDIEPRSRGVGLFPIETSNL